MSDFAQQTDVYDYIICGGGTAGCVIAARLAEDPKISVLVIEAGDSNDAYPASVMPGGLASMVGTDADWKIQSEPCEKVNGRQINLTRGKLLGGCSGCNGMLAIRGCRQDYDSWGIKGWSGDELFDYMRKAETFNNQPWFDAKTENHGSSGPILTEPHVPAPISTKVLESYQSLGMPLIPDMFSSGETAHGCGHIVYTHYKGIRSSSVNYITNSNAKANIHIKTKTYTDSIILEKDGVEGLRAIGVNLVTSHGGKSVVKARKEVIVSAGAYGSPAILLRSGIGPKNEVENLGIKSQVDLPGVGKNLLDHPVLFSCYEVSKPGLTHDHHIWHTGGMDKSLAEYQKDNTGFFSQWLFGTFAFARLDDRLADSPLWQKAHREKGLDPMGLSPNQPHVEIWNTECYIPRINSKDSLSNTQYAFNMAVELFGLRSRGEVTIKSLDPMQNPVVDHNYFDDPLDLLVLSEGCRLANDIVMKGAGTKDIVTGSWPSSLKHESFTTREEWEPVIREHLDTCYHPAGTCKMGTTNDEMAVLDEELRVRGVKGLRVADASIMPTLMGGHPQMPVYGIGEKAADLIKSSK